MCFRADEKKPESRDKLQSREMTGDTGSYLFEKPGWYWSRGHDLAGVFLMRTAPSCSVTGSNTVSEGADLGEMGGGGAFAEC